MEIMVAEQNVGIWDATEENLTGIGAVDPSGIYAKNLDGRHFATSIIVDAPSTVYIQFPAPLAGPTTIHIPPFLDIFRGTNGRLNPGFISQPVSPPP